MVIFLKKELSSLDIKNLLYFLERKFFLYFRKWNSALFSPSSKNKRNPPLKKIFILQETKTLEKFLIFSKKDAFLIFRNMETPKKFFIFQETKTPEKFLIFSNFLLFRNMETPKKFFIFQKRKFLIFHKRYIQNPGVVKTWDILRTLSNI